jgi:HTH-type transcriptional regulator, competence development regulator
MFGPKIRERREQLKELDEKSYSLRKVASRVGIEPAYLSKIEKGNVPAPSDQVVYKLAQELNVNANELMAQAERLPKVLKDAFSEHPRLVAELAEVIKRHDKSKPLNLKSLLEGYKLLDGVNLEEFSSNQSPLETKQTPALWGKEEARRLLLEKGFTVENNESSPNSNSLLAYKNDSSFVVWPKTSWKERLIRLGAKKSLNNKDRNDFFFGFVPKEGAANVSEQYQLFIVRGDLAKEDGLEILAKWLEKKNKDGSDRKDTMGVILKDVNRDPHREIWDRWTGRFKDGWEWLP